MPGLYQQAQSGAGPPPRVDYSSRQDDYSHQGGHQIPAVPTVLQAGAKLEN